MAAVKVPKQIPKWTALKLEHLDCYLQGYVQATKAAKEIHYIDAFASCGDCAMRDTGQLVQGSPWRALNAIPRFSQYHFIEKNRAYATHLKSRIAESRISNATIDIGDCNRLLPSEVLPRIPRDVPTFAFLYPDGLQLDWATVVAVAAHRRPQRVELLILYPYDMAVKRQFPLAATSSSHRDKLTRFYGTDSWLREYERSVEDGESTEQRRLRFVQFYRENLLELGYRHVEPYGPMCSNRGPLYHVVFAGDNDVGVKIMRDVWARPRYVPGELFYKPLRRPNPTHGEHRG